MTRKKILIVDDSRVVLKAFQSRLEAEGYEIRTAEDPSSALTAAREYEPDVLIMDVNFPADVGAVSWDGIKLLTWLRASGAASRVPAIIITSDLAQKHDHRARLAGAVAVFQKPVKVTQLLEAIRTCTEGVGQAA
jgi:CheY-like chemotaxis protein